ncbi:ACL116Wp [Eremothecium gossypii ATCC 10895]|uniref:Elongator complex protein 2 n=1 Tax=Eremothecium gossypii (strain ATCC 10895 / CBS 109.51 / FGSC 9923 / NRRL Y-1056) TaxID=284811 RepID=Q75CN5_EREGS|nr:ACL116Wp [Eremothecium gossypii ATCC 10895]AAS51112.1 ACL116Wp [Eremothecium gossypii ATCC 10895]
MAVTTSTHLHRHYGYLKSLSIDNMATQEAVFIGANRQTKVADFYLPTKTVAFGAGKCIALWNPLDEHNAGVYCTLKAHNAEVTSVKFIGAEKLLVSASADATINVWRGDERWELAQTLEGPKSSVTSLAVAAGLIVAGFADGTLSVWSEHDDAFVLSSQFLIRKGFLPLALALQKLSDGCYMLAVSGTSTDLMVYSVCVAATVDVELSATVEGHEDWIKDLAFRSNGPGDWMLASGAQDRYIRLWRIKANNNIEEEDPTKLKLLSNKIYKFQVTADLHLSINFEALIMGHDDWISSLQWHESKCQLLAATADTSVMLWEPDEISGIWVCASRLGEFSSKGASTATGSAGGFWSCLWFATGDAEYILANGKTGSWRMWENRGDGGSWEQLPAITGPTRSVTDVAWSPSGSYLLASSLDQTTRLYTRWMYEGDGSRRKHTWHEFARPQIHGYDMICLEPISDTQFISAGDEKVLRSFNEPRAIAKLLERLSGISADTSSTVADAAALPALGLSNKASVPEGNGGTVEDNDARETNETTNITAAMLSQLQTPPLEDHLQRHTLWPEIEKLYGHGYEISCVDVSPDGKLLASACKSNNTSHAVVRIFSTHTWLQLPPCPEFHNLTITRLRFSKDNRHLLSVSRDRMWAVWYRNDDDTFTLKYSDQKPHSRIIWDGDWLPASCGTAFVTASRDKTVKIWRLDGQEGRFEVESNLKLKEAITAVAVTPRLIEGRLLLAFGLESGAVHIYTYSERAFLQVLQLDSAIAPADRINRIRWNPAHHKENIMLSVASADSSVRIYSVKVPAVLGN